MNIEELVSLVSEQNRSEQVAAIAQAILENEGKLSVDKTMSGKDIYSAYVNAVGGNREDLIPKNTFLACLSIAKNNENTTIFSKGRKQGYYLSQALTEIDKEADEKSDDASVGEESLYPYFRDWLISKGYRARIVAERKKNHKWGNPDVLGIKFTSILGRMQEEIVTIECKRSVTNWRHEIFEAIAHKRFSDRSYFAFACPEDAAQKIIDEMARYAEYYGIGILLVELPETTYKDLLNGVSITEDEIDVQEIYPARYQKPILESRIEFLQRIPANTMTELLDYVTLEN